MPVDIIKLIENECGESLRSKGFPAVLVDREKKKEGIEVNKND